MTHPLIAGRLREDIDYRPYKRLKLKACRDNELPSSEEISSISLLAFDIRVARREEVCEFSRSETKFIKASRRMIKNRDHARLSRKRKKQLVIDLQHQVSMLEEEIKRLHDAYIGTIGHNIKLLSELEQYKLLEESRRNPDTSLYSSPEQFVSTDISEQDFPWF